MAKKEELIISLKLDTKVFDDAAIAAQKFVDVINSSNANKDQKETAKILLDNLNKEIVLAKKLAENKDKFNKKDIENLRKYDENIDSSLKKLFEFTSKLDSGTPSIDIQNIQKQLGQITNDARIAIDKIKEEFKDTFKIDYGDESINKALRIIDAEINEKTLAREANIEATRQAGLKRLESEDGERIEKNKEIEREITESLKNELNIRTKSFEEFQKLVIEIPKDQAELEKKLDKERQSRKAKDIQDAKDLLASGTATPDDYKRFGVKGKTGLERVAKGDFTDTYLKNLEKGLELVRQENLDLMKNLDILKDKFFTLKLINEEQEKYDEKQKEINVAADIRRKNPNQEFINYVTPRETRKNALISARDETKTKIDEIQNQEEIERTPLLEQERKAFEKNNETFKDYKTNILNSTQPLVKAFDETGEAIERTAVTLDKLHEKQETVGEVTDLIKTKLLQLVSVTYLLDKASEVIRRSISVVSDLDKEITQIGIVTKQTTAELWQSFEMFNRVARGLSTTTREYLEGAKIFYQQGMNTAQVMSMVEATTKAAALSSVTFTQASETLTASINAYNMEASKAMDVTDKFAAVGAYSAADFQELSTSMEKVASSAYTAGMSFDATLGILAKGIETTREAPEAINIFCQKILVFI